MNFKTRILIKFFSHSGEKIPFYALHNKAFIHYLKYPHNCDIII